MIIHEEQTATNLLETIAHYEIYQGSEREQNSCNAFFVLDRASNSAAISRNAWTFEEAKNWAIHQVEGEAQAYENEKNNRKYAKVKPHVSNRYEIGALLVYSWGYDQTNIDYYCIVDVSKSGQYVTLLPVKSAAVKETGWLQGDCVASNTICFSKKAFRRKLSRGRDQNIIGIAINSYGWCNLYDGGVDHWTAYH